MLLADTLRVFTLEHGETNVEIRANHLFAVSKDALHPAVTIEILAQSAAAHEGYRRLSSGGDLGGGFLAVIRDFELLEAPKVGDVLDAIATRDLQIGELQLVRGEITRGSQTIAKGELLFYLSDELMPEAMRDLGDRAGDPEPCYTSEPIVKAIESSLQNVDPHSGHAQYFFERSFPAFDGHFPSFPMLPAVVSLICAENAVAHFAGDGWSVGRVKRAKFTKPVMPGSTIDAVCTPDSRQRQEHWRVHLHVAGDVIAKLDLEGAVNTTESESCG
jgi:3-hydroxymyristoyl/3-hydroxydecanoyl-(acyl carrier protein) dehydratase/predicted hotdog family 3-hydroxylacyl-ACP dehydratase